MPNKRNFVPAIKTIKYQTKVTKRLMRKSDIIVYFNVNLKLLTKLINSAFVGEGTT